MQEIETEQKNSLLSKVKNYFQEVRKEIQLVSWPSRSELKKYTKLVIVSTLACGFGVYIVDLTCKGFLDFLRYLTKLLFI